MAPLACTRLYVTHRGSLLGLVAPASVSARLCGSQVARAESIQSDAQRRKLRRGMDGTMRRELSRCTLLVGV